MRCPQTAFPPRAGALATVFAAGLAAAACGALAGCGSRIGAPTPLDGGAASDQGAGSSCQPAYPCDKAGATRCVIAQIQRCVDDGTGCLGWGPPADCPGDGATCVMGACIDVCTLADAMTACTQAAKDVNNCCGGTLAQVAALDLCHLFAKAGKDPKATCAQFTLQTDCATVQARVVAGGGCCCPTDNVCDPESGGKCVPTCTKMTSCSGNPGGAYCAPAGKDGLITLKAWVCRPDDGKPLHACELLANNGCSGGTDCWRDGLNNRICTTSCDADADCKNPGVACCDTTLTCNKLVGSCGGKGACVPCRF